MGMERGVREHIGNEGGTGLTRKLLNILPEKFLSNIV
jgi:hypothetical protein